MNDKQLKRLMETYDQQNSAQQKATVQLAMSAIGQSLDTLKQIAESVRPVYTLAKSMPAEQFNEQLRVWCEGDEEKIEATINLIWLIDHWRLLE